MARHAAATSPVASTAAVAEAAPVAAPPAVPASAAVGIASEPPLPAPVLVRKTSRTRQSFLSRGVASDAGVTVSAGVPEGFEEFLKPQKTLVDLYFGGRSLGAVMAEYTPDSIELQRPDEIAERIPNALNRAEIAHRLKGRLERNSELACPPRQLLGCGKLEPEVVGVIFDESRFRVDLFVHPDLLAVQAQNLTRYLPAPQDPAGLTLVQNLGVVASQDSNREGAHTINGNTWVGMGSDHVHAEWFSTAQQDLAIDQLAWRRDLPDHSLAAGLFEARNDDLYFSQSALLAGAGAGRSLKLRTDIASESATRLLLFLDTRSAVEVYRDGRLLTSQFYDPGNQQLDTSGLPYGSYDIEIRVVDAAGKVSTQSRFFIKTTQLAPPGEPQWFLEGGEVMLRSRDSVMPEDTQTLQLRGGWRDRLREDVGYALAGAAVNTHAMTEGTLTWLQPRFSLTGTLMVSTQGDSGWVAIANGRWGDLTGGIGVRDARAAVEPGGTDDYQLLAGTSYTRNLSLNYPVLAGQLSAQVFNNRSAGTDSEIYSLRYTRNLLLGVFPPVFVNAQITNADGDLIASLGIDISGFGENWNWRMSPGMRLEETSMGGQSSAPSLAAAAGWRDGERWSEDVEASVRTTVEDAATTLGLDGRYASDYGRLQASVDDVRGDFGSVRRFTARYEASLVAGHGNVALGGRQMAAGSVLFDLRSAPAEAEFDVYIDGRKYTSVRGGRQIPLMLPAYRSYSISLADRGMSLLQFDTTPRMVTVYPGSVASLDYQVQQVVIGFGRVLLRPAGCVAADCREPLANARLHGIAGLAMTEDDGSFQAEMLTGTARLRAVKSGAECSISLPAPRWVNGILMLGDLECELQVTAMPAPTLAVPDQSETAAAAIEAAPAALAPEAIVAPVPAPEVPVESTATTQPSEVPVTAVSSEPVPQDPIVVPATAAAGNVKAVPARQNGPAKVSTRASSKQPITKRAVTASRKSAPAPAARGGALASEPEARNVEQRRRRERLRRNAAKVEKTRAELVINNGGKAKAPAKKREQKPVSRRERLERNAKKIDRLLKE